MNSIINYFSLRPGAVAAIFVVVTVILLVWFNHFIKSRIIKRSKQEGAEDED